MYDNVIKGQGCCFILFLCIASLFFAVVLNHETQEIDLHRYKIINDMLDDKETPQEVVTLINNHMKDKILSNHEFDDIFTTQIEAKGQRQEQYRQEKGTIEKNALINKTQPPLYIKLD